MSAASRPGRSVVVSAARRSSAARRRPWSPVWAGRCTTSGSVVSNGWGLRRSSRYFPHSSSTFPARSATAVSNGAGRGATRDSDST